jgi:hypothetical protein
MLIGALLLGMCWLYLMWNTKVGELAPKLRFRTKQTIAGIFEAAAPQLNFENIVNNRYQRFVSQTIGQMSPVYATATHWKNQFYYSVLGVSTYPDILVGGDRQLLQAIYINEYCTRNLTTFRPQAEAWASMLQRVQDFFQARGKTFLYVITPSKPAVYPQYLPNSYNCPSNQYDRLHRAEVYRAILDRRGIQYVDGTELIAANRDKFAISMFPRGGIHWNMQGASLVAKAITDKLNALRGPDTLTPFTFSVAPSYSPENSDRDLMEILNLLWPDYHYEVPVVTYHPASRREPCRPLRIAEVAGSFLFNVNDALSQITCPAHIRDWWYWDNRLFEYPPVLPKDQPVDATQRRHDLLDDADIIIFEENEALLPVSSGGEKLVEFVRNASAESAR